MPQLFPPSANTLSRLTILLVVVGLAALGVVGYGWVQSSYATGVGRPVEQPVPFSHEHHVGGLGLDCRYCHTTVEKASFAGMPSTHTCMTCHSQVWADSPMLAPVRDSLASGEPLAWNRVNDLPDYAYFDHRAHVTHGVGCVSCHGRVDRMPLMAQAHPMRMQWCLSCHRAPEQHLRPMEAVFDMEWHAKDQKALGERLVAEYRIPRDRLGDCYTCHR